MITSIIDADDIEGGDTVYHNGEERRVDAAFQHDTEIVLWLDGGETLILRDTDPVKVRLDA